MAVDVHKLIREDWQVHCRIYTDPEIFNEEMKRIWQKSWLFVAHESEIPNPGDFKSFTLAQHPVIVVRDDTGQVRVLLNICRHRRVPVCRQEKGNTKFFQCTYHGWTYNTKGNLVGLSSGARYICGFHERRGLSAVPRMDSYRGFIFASFSSEGESLEQHLGKAKFFIDLVVDQSADGSEVIGSVHRYGHIGNWKLQIEKVKAGKEGRAIDCPNSWGTAKDLGNGHAVWEFSPSPQYRVISQRRQELEKRIGVERTKQICETGRNLFIFPNLFLMDQTSSSLRVINPVACDYTEISAIPLVPKGEPEELRNQRLRQYDTSESERIGAATDETVQRGQYRQWMKLMAQ